jgi:Tfp pilus assembly protein PilO
VRKNELMILVSLVCVALIAGFYVLAIGPKRNEAASLKSDIDQLHATLAQAQQSVATGEAAQKSFGSDYRKLVVLGKAVPTDGDQASLLIQLQRLADRSGVGFQSIDLSDSSASSSAAAPAPTTPAPTTPAPATPAPSGSTASTSTPTSSTTSTSSTSTAPAAAPTATATEATAAVLPIGASIGPAGLPVMPYELKFTGGFFQIADFMQKVDGMVHLRHGSVSVDGRLLTVDGFTLASQLTDPAATGAAGASDTLTADLSVTTYLTPADQGITAGASPAGPAPPTTTTAAGTTPAPTSTTTSATPTSSAPATTP